MKRLTMKTFRYIPLITLCLLALGCTKPNGTEWTPKQRHEARTRERRIIYNNDGTDFATSPHFKITTEEEFLSKRTAVHTNTMVDTISYCTTAGSFGTFLHRTKVGREFTYQDPGSSWQYNPMSMLLALGTDPLDAVVRFCRKNNIEILWSFRMNDTHDYNPKNRMFFSDFKKEHPETMFGTDEAPPRYGRWSGVDYLSSVVREFALAAIDEVLANYPVDGIELDFWRHPMFFKDVAWGKEAGPEHLEVMTGFVKAVRERLDRVGLERGQYLQLAIKYPDSLEYCRRLGMDIQKWLDEDMVDMLIPGGGYFQFSQWKDSVDVGHKAGVPVYPSLSDVRVIDRDSDIAKERRGNESLRGRALSAWTSGADGIAVFNQNPPSLPFWNEIGSKPLLQTLPKFYFVSPQGEGGRTPMKSRQFFPVDKDIHFPTVSPDSPDTIPGGQPTVYPLMVGDNLPAHPNLGAKLLVRVGNSVEDPPRVLWDKTLLTVRGEEGGWSAAVPDADVTPGLHHIAITPVGEAVLQDIKLSIFEKGS